jgi:NAD(P)-dependent dehydrogenase (short-subunit alcohol dehydrogenase family)
MITGAGGGLSQATARLLAQSGWSLALVGRDRAALEAVHRDLLEDAPSPTGSIKIALVQADLRSGEGAVQAVESARALLEAPLDGLVYCADNAASRAARSSLDGAFLTLGAFADQMIADGVPASAVLVSTSAAKDGSASLVDAAAATYAPRGLRINAVAPALMSTPVILRFFGDRLHDRSPAEHYPLGRWGEVLDTARTVRWLLGEDAHWINGQVLPLDGERGTAPATAPAPGPAL